MNKILANLVRIAFVMVFVITAGCASPTVEKPVQTIIQPPPLFPPQKIMQGGDYAAFLAENESTLKTCTDPELCTAALFNISFLYCYPKSPYHNPAKGRRYLEDLIKGAPESPWAYQAQVWLEMMKKTLLAQNRKSKARDEVKSKDPQADSAKQAEADEIKRTEDDAAKLADAPREVIPDSDRKRLEEEIRTRDDTIQALKNQIERTRKIDLEIEKKERKLLY